MSEDGRFSFSVQLDIPKGREIFEFASFRK
jgi:hypothetical protein